MSYKSTDYLPEENYDRVREAFLIAEHNFEVRRKEKEKAQSILFNAEHRFEIARRKKIKAQSDMFNAARAVDSTSH